MPDAAAIADAVAAAVEATPGVVRLHPGRGSEVATYLPGRRVRGVRVLDDTVEVHVVLEWAADLTAVAARVHRAAAAAAGDYPVHVVIADVRVPDEQPAEPTTKGAVS